MVSEAVEPRCSSYGSVYGVRVKKKFFRVIECWRGEGVSEVTTKTMGETMTMTTRETMAKTMRETMTKTTTADHDDTDPARVRPLLPSESEHQMKEREKADFLSNEPGRGEGTGKQE